MGCLENLKVKNVLSLELAENKVIKFHSATEILWCYKLPVTREKNER